jgi:hypothetical protein
MVYEFFPCAHCYYALSEKSAPAATMWFSFSTNLIEGSPFVYVQQVDPKAATDHIENDFRVLEQYGYFVTHELPDAIWVIRYNGIKENSVICVGNHVD